MYFSIEEILPHIYHLCFGTKYDVAMHFIRYQEYYESPKFFKKTFSLAEYMRWYSKTYGKGAFTYPDDWRGFNAPSWALLGVRHFTPPDYNRPEDDLMTALIDQVLEEEGEHPFYFIGTSVEGEKEEGKPLLDHEIAHALFTVDAEYRDSVSELLTAWAQGQKPFDQKEFNKASQILAEMGYHASTIVDELHAYCATGLCEELDGIISKKFMKPFQKLFQEHKHLKEKK